MQLRIVHTTEFTYDGGARASFNQARLTPTTTPEQIVVHERLDITPAPWTYGYTDYFGTPVVAFEIADPHERMAVVATSTVQVNRPPAVAPTTPWAAYGERSIADRWTEFLMLPPTVSPPEELAARARAVRDTAALPGTAAREVCALVHAEMAPAVEAPEGASAAEAWEERAGGTREITHLAIGALRALGIPARYVAGYAHPDPAPEVGTTVECEARAWLEWWDDGWQGYDPTADAVPDDRYVGIGFGRDADDVAPLRGIYSGDGASTMQVHIAVTRLR